MITKHFLVYGTLRPGCCNYAHFFPYVEHTAKSVRVPGFRMYGTAGFPYALRGNEIDSIVASLITVTGTVDDVEYLMSGLDMLEGYDENRRDNHYDRIKVEIEGVEAFLYVANARFEDDIIVNRERLLSGDWYDVDPPAYEGVRIHSQEFLDAEYEKYQTNWLSDFQDYEAV